MTRKSDSKNRKQRFIDAAITSLAEHGYKATTVRKIAAFAGVTPGLLTHYFPGKEVLIAESYRYLSETFLERFEARIRGLEDDPVTALRTFFEATFDASNLDPKLLKVWLSFWSLTLNEPDLKHIHCDSHRHYVDAVARLLGRAYELENQKVPAEKIRKQALGVNALLDGLWLEWCLDPDSFTPDEGLEVVYGFLEGLTGISFLAANND